ncbi:MAG: IclR family transcriptional regulator C-terminal domain-containing protein, partial [Candidatus Lokiarchaeota archaeon]|nr:IclR family transcriptional regulator C-terminal domain-containing protein [Candidatus Lokiarchaeota archaeon]
KERGLKKYTENTIINKKELENEFKKIREQGYALDNIEHEEGVRCVAGPIRDYSGKVIASMSISGPAFRINESNILGIAKKVKEYCDCISKEMGYSNSSSE